MGSSQGSGKQREQASKPPARRRARTRLKPAAPMLLQRSALQAGSAGPASSLLESSNGSGRAGQGLRLLSELAHADLTLAESQVWLAASLAQLFGAQAGALLLVHGDRSDLVVCRREVEEPIWRYDLQLGNEDSLLRRWLEERFFSPGCPEGQFPELHSGLGDLFSLPALGLPLRSDEGALGFLALLGLPGLHSETGTLLELIASSAASTLNHLRQIQKLMVSNADLEASQWQLMRSRNTLRALFDSIPTSIYIVDRKYNLVAINLNRANQTGQPPNELVGRRCYEALYGLDDVCADCRVVETLFGECGSCTTRTRRLWKTDEDPQEWEISTYPIFDDAGRVVQAIVLEQDVTEKRRLEATLAQSEKLAAVGQLAAGLAHEINNPLTAIIANAQILQRELPRDDDKQELVDLIARAGQRATQVVRNLLDLARKEQYDFAPTDLNDSIRKALALLQHEFVSRSVELIFEPASGLPLIKASENHLQGVWVNLITNAMDALEAEHNEIRILTRRQGSEVRVTVADSGKGMAPERLSRIFEPFYTTKGPGRGTGLGLSVCHRVIKQHGGRIMVDSQIGVGTQFTVVLPIA